jgi:hypothetical protein
MVVEEIILIPKALMKTPGVSDSNMLSECLKSGGLFLNLDLK